jgi:hypothetical protein
MCDKPIYRLCALPHDRFMSAKNPDDRRVVAQIAANARWSQQDPKPALVPVRAARMARYENQVDPEGNLPEAERQRRAQAALRADMLRMALRSAQARRRRKADDP